MRLYLLLVVISLIFVNGLDEKLILGFLQTKLLRVGIIIDCQSKERQIGWMKKAITDNSLVILKVNDSLENVWNDRKQVGIIVNGQCPNVQQFLHNAGNSNYFASHHHWLIISPKNISLAKIPFNIDCDVNIALSTGVILDIYNPAYHRNGTLITKNIGFYNSNTYYIFDPSKNKYWSRRNMSGVTFKSMIVLAQPFSGSLEDYLLNDNNRHIDSFNRFQHQLIRHCSDYYNFKLNTSQTKSWGYLQPNGSFDGVVGALHAKTIDFSCSCIRLTAERMARIDYARNTWTFRTCFIFRRPKSRSFVDVFLKPMENSVWFALIISTILTAIALKLTLNGEVALVTLKNSLESSWSSLVLSTLGALCQQGAASTPQFLCGRMVTFSMFIFSFLFYQFYSANIVSLLLSEPSLKIKSLWDLFNSNVKVGYEEILYNHDYLKFTTDEAALALYENRRLANNSGFFSMKDGLQILKDNDIAFYAETATAYPLIEKTFSEKLICELEEVVMIPTEPMFTILQKRSPFRDMLNHCMCRIAEHGLLYRQKKHWHARKPTCFRSAHSLTIQMGLEEFYPSLLVLAVGIGISLFILLLELTLTTKGFYLFTKKTLWDKKYRQKIKVVKIIRS